MKRHTPEDDPERLDAAGPLFAKTHARTEDPTTSKAASARAPELASRHCLEILGALRGAAHGLTCDDVAQRLGTLDRHQVGRRMSDLERQGAVRAAGTVRPTPRGRMAIVWEATLT